MRMLRGLSVVVLAVAALGSPAARGGAVVATGQVGTAKGVMEYFVYSGTYHSTGRYSMVGQLGSGSYAIDVESPESPCDATKLTGTVTLTRSDGATLHGDVTNPLACNDGVGERLTVHFDQATRDLRGADLVITRAASKPIGVSPSGGRDLEVLTLAGRVDTRRRVGYWALGRDGALYAFGGVGASARTSPPARAVSVAATRFGGAWWELFADGTVVAHGRARTFDGPGRGVLLPGESYVAIVATPTARGYWLVTDHGRVQPLGDAVRHGDLSRVALHAPIVGAAGTPTGDGYWLVASDGGVFAFGDARFRGSTGAIRLARPVVGMAATADGRGYWLVASDGGVFAFGDAPFRGSLGNVRLASPITGMARYGNGYLMSAEDGGMFNFSNGPFFGSLADWPLARPIVAIAATG